MYLLHSYVALNVCSCLDLITICNDFIIKFIIHFYTQSLWLTGSQANIKFFSLYQTPGSFMISVLWFLYVWLFNPHFVVFNHTTKQSKIHKNEWISMKICLKLSRILNNSNNIANDSLLVLCLKFLEWGFCCYKLSSRCAIFEWFPVTCW